MLQKNARYIMLLAANEVPFLIVQIIFLHSMPNEPFFGQLFAEIYQENLMKHDFKDNFPLSKILICVLF